MASLLIITLGHQTQTRIIPGQQEHVVILAVGLREKKHLVLGVRACSQPTGFYFKVTRPILPQPWNWYCPTAGSPGIFWPQGFPGGSAGKESACSAGDLGSIPGLGRSPGEGKGYPLQYSSLQNFMDRGAWWAIVHGVPKIQT